MPIIKYKDGKEVGRYANRKEAATDLKVKGQLINLHLIGRVKLINGFRLLEVSEPAPSYELTTTSNGEPLVIEVHPMPRAPILLPLSQVVEPVEHNKPPIQGEETQSSIPEDFHLTPFMKLLKRKNNLDNL